MSSDLLNTALLPRRLEDHATPGGGGRLEAASKMNLDELSIPSSEKCMNRLETTSGGFPPHPVLPHNEEWQISTLNCLTRKLAVKFESNLNS